MDNVMETTAEDRAQQVYRSYTYLAERGVFDIVYEEAAEILSDEQAKKLARRVACSVRTHANMAGVDVPPVGPHLLTTPHVRDPHTGLLSEDGD